MDFVIPIIVVGVLVAGLSAGLVVMFCFRAGQGATSSNGSNRPTKTFGTGPAFVSLVLQSSETVNHNIKRLRFNLPNHDAISGLPATSTLLTLSRPSGHLLPAIRPYTPISSGDQRGYVDLLVKRYPNGKASTHLHAMAPGQSLLFMAALKGYQWRQNSHKHIVLIAGGSGITPIYQLIQDIMLNPEDTTGVTLVFGVNNDEDVLFEAQFAQWAKLYPGRFKVVYAVTYPTAGSPYHKGRVTRELLQEVITGPGSRVTMAFVSGPAAMEKALLGNGILKQLGFQSKQIHKF